MKKPRRLIIVIALGIVVVGAGLTATLWWLNQAAEQQAIIKKTPQYTAKQQLVDEVNKKYGTKDFAGAIRLIEGQKTVDDVEIQLLLAGAYANSGNTKKALEIYKQIDAAGKLPAAETANFATMAEQAGEYQIAIDAYKKAKAYAASSDTETDDQIAVYEYKISQLEKKK